MANFANDPGLRLTFAITGASGSVFAAEMLRALAADARVARVDLVPSDAALRVFAEEMQLSGRHGLVEKLLGESAAASRERSSCSMPRRTSGRASPAAATARQE